MSIEFESRCNYNLISNRYKDFYDSEEVSTCFEGVKDSIQNFEIKNIKLQPAEKEWVQQRIEKYQLTNPKLLPAENDFEDRSEVVNSPIYDNILKLNTIKERTLAIQRLLNYNYKDNEVYYSLAFKLLSNNYPFLNNYFNPRDHEFYRTLTPNGLRWVIEDWKSSGKLSPTMEYTVCDTVNNLESVIKNLKDRKLCIFFLMGDTPDLRGDHSIPIFITENKQAIIMDSAGAAGNFLKITANLLDSFSIDFAIRGFKWPRQATPEGCKMFALHDASEMSHHFDDNLQIIENSLLSEIWDKAPNCRLFTVLPENMMRLAQTRFWLASATKDEFVGEFNNEDKISALEKKGYCIMDQQRQGLTNIRANKMSAQIERKIIENALRTQNS